MGAKKTAVLRALLREIVKGERPESASPLFDQANTHLSAVAQLDYGAALRRHFDRGQLLQVVAEMRRSVPGLNRQVFATTDLRRLGEVAEALGARLQVSSFDGREGRQLRGFYVDDGRFRARPLIWVNTANHPVAVAAAFWHEAGHHLGRRLVG